jgi:long-chain fatty acid transport protein
MKGKEASAGAPKKRAIWEGNVLWHPSRATLAASLVAGLLSANHALASGFELREQSAVGQGAAFAGAAARGDDPSFAFYNPAAIGWLTGWDFSAVLSGLLPESRMVSGSATRAAAFGGTPITGSLGGDAAQDALLGSLYASMPLSERVRVGLSVTEPFGLATKYPVDFIGRYHAYTSYLRTIDVTPSLAWRPLDTLSLGVSLIVQTADAHLSNAIDGGAVILGTNPLAARLGVRPGGLDFRSTLRGDSTGVGFQLGGQWEVAPGTRLGFSYRSAITQRLDGTAKFDGVPPLLATSFSNTTGSAKLTLPDIATFGVTHQLTPRLNLMGGVEWTGWSRFKELTAYFGNGLPPSVTEQRWRDTWFVSLGAEFQVTEKLTLRGGGAYDQSPVPTATRTPRIPDGDRYWLSVGASYRVLSNVTLIAAYTHIFVDDTKVALSAGPPSSSNFLRGNLTGTYHNQVDLVSVQARITF